MLADHVPAYDPNLPENAPKPPGYWAVKSQSEGAPVVGDLGTLAGMMGSGLQKYTEEVPQRFQEGVGNVMGALPRQVLQGLSDFNTSFPMSPLMGAQARMGLAAQDARQMGQPFQEAYADQASGLERFMTQAAYDPITYLPGLNVAAKGTAFAPAISAANKAVNLPGEAVWGGLKGIAGMTKTVADRVLPESINLAESSKSTAAQVIQSVTDLVNQAPAPLSTLITPLRQIGRYSLPTTRSGIDIRGATEQVGKRLSGIEERILANPDPISQVRDLSTLAAMRSVVAQQRDQLQQYLGTSFAKAPPEIGIPSLAGTGEATTNQLARGGKSVTSIEDDLTKQGAWRAWYDNWMRGMDALEEQIKSPMVPPTGYAGLEPGYVGLTPVQAKARDIAEQFIGDIRQNRADMMDKIRMVQRDMASGRTDLESGRELVGNMYSELDQYHVNKLQDLAETMKNTLGIKDEPFGSLLGTPQDEYLNRLNSLQTSAVGGPGGLGLMVPTRLKDTMSKVYDLWFPQVMKVQGDQSRLVDHIRDMLGNLPEKSPVTNLPWDMESMWKELQGRAEAAGNTLPDLGVATSEDLKKTIHALNGKDVLDKMESNKIVNLLDKWKNRGDILLDDPLHLALGPTQDLLEKALGAEPISAHPGIAGDVAKFVNTNRKMYREKTLTSPSYLLTNFPSALLSNLSYGPRAALNGLKYARELLVNYQWATGNPGRMGEAALLPKDVRDEYSIFGIPTVPSAQASGWITGTYNSLSGTKTATEATPFLGRLAFNTATSGLNPVGQLWGVAQAVAGPAVTRWARNMAQIEEGAVRMALGMEVLRPTILRQFPDFFSDAAAIARAGVQAGKPGIAPTHANVGAFLSWLWETKGLTKTSDIVAQARQNGISREATAKIGQKWTDIVDSGLQAGNALADKHHVAYNQFSNLEEALDNVFMFSRWPIHIAPLVAEKLLQNPAVILSLNRFNTMTKQDAEQAGLSDKYKTAASAGKLGDLLAERILGANSGGPGGQARFDPSRVLEPWNQYGNNMRGVQYSKGLPEALANLLPFSMYPDVQIAAQAGSGAIAAAKPELAPFVPFQPDTPFPGVDRYAGLAGYAGGRPESLLEALYKRLPGLDPYSFLEADIQKRIGEMATERTGFPDHPLYQAARALRAGPIYKEAEQQVLHQKAVEQFFGTMFPASLKVARPGEIKQGLAAQNLPSGRRDTPEKQKAYQAELEKHPWAAAYQGVSGADLPTQVQYLFNAMHNPAVLFPDANPEVATKLGEALNAFNNAPEAQRKSMEKMNPMIGVARTRLNDFLRNFPSDVARSWMFWRQQFHPAQRVENESSLTEQFITWYQAGGRAPRDFKMD